jgi:hypothetical protein
MTTTPAKRPAVLRLQDGLLVCIVLLVGAMAGAASFTHVHDWTMHNSPTRTGDWFGWANAVITELIPTAALIVIARRRRANPGAPIGYPMFLLVVAVGLSLTAQLAVARFTVFGWMVSALPAAAFFALSKLVFTATRPAPSPVDPAPAAITTVEALHHLATRVTELETRPTPPVSALTPATDATTPSTEVPAVASARPAAKKTTAKKTSPRRAPAKKTTSTKATPAAEPVSTVDDAPSALPVPEPTTTAKLLPQARIIAQAHHATHGTRITPGQLAVRMRIGTDLAEHILDALGDIPTAANTAPHNGTPTSNTTSGVPA